MQTLRSFILLSTVTIAFGVSFVMLAQVIGIASPWLELLLMFYFLGLAKIGEPFFLFREPKIIGYLLAPEHPEGAGKAEFFAHFGCAVEAWEVLAEALLAHGRTHPVASMSETRYGTQYRIEGPVVCLDGRTPSIRPVASTEIPHARELAHH